MSEYSCVQEELVAQLRDLWGSVPPPGASAARLAWWHLRKAEWYDAFAAMHPAMSLHAKEIATRARYQARALSGDSRNV